MGALLEFECRPPVSGYRISTFDQRKFVNAKFSMDGELTSPLPEGTTDDERYLLERHGITVTPFGDEPKVEKVLIPISDKTKKFDLFHANPEAYLAFANTPTRPEDIKAFADQFGSLHGHAVIGGDFISSWSWSIRAMHRAVMAWKKANETNDFSTVAKLVTQRGATRFGVSPVNFLLKQDALAAAPRLCLHPDGLFDALWMQLALAIDGSHNLRGCVECGCLFTLEAGRGRSDKEYCSNACRMRAYRKRKGRE